MSGIRKQAIISSILVYIGIPFGALNTYFFVKQGAFSSDQYGLTRLFNDVAQNFYVIASLGVIPIIYKFYPYYKDNLSDEENDLLGRSFVKALIGFILVAIACFVFEPLVIRKFTARSKLFVEYYFWVLPYAFGWLFFSLLEGYAWALQKTVLSNFLKETGVRLITTFFIVFYFLRVVSFHEFMYLFSMLYIIIAVILLVYLIRTKKFHFTFKKSRVTKKFRKKVFAMHKPDFVFHAAAYKHVPLMETFTSEAVLTNIFGTKVVADLAMAFRVKKFVMVSTDKAVNPSNVMGTTKRISEIYIQSLSDRKDSETAFITTRFGNVLGSAGSVVRTFNKQIKAGGPITITHPEITRYFMTIPEASKLVLEAGKIGESGDILLFDMGEPVKIMDLAKRMIQLAGLKPTDIAIVQTGLRPGEKMYEELFKDSEEFAETYHPRILRAKKSPEVNGEFNNLMNELREVALMHNNEMIPFILRKMVPEFTSSTGALNKVVSEQELESSKN